MATVVFYGDLQQYGKRFDLKVENAGEAMRALFAQIAGLRQHIAQGGYFVRVARKDVSEQSIQDDFKKELNDGDVIHVVPEVTGAGKYSQIIIGAVMIGAAFFTGGASIALWGAATQAMAIAGASMMLGGVAQLLVKQPSFGTDEVDKPKSSSFSNLGNQAAEGSCVSIAFGHIRVGAKTISQSVESYKINGGG